ncbi:MAG TPA: YCF48-related protein [Bryobacteraceae bacterium]
MYKWFCISGILTLGFFGPRSASAQDRTCWLRDGSSPAPSLVYLLCEQGAFLVTTDGGTTWSTHEVKTKGHLRNIDFIDANHGFAVGDSGLLTATSDGGKTWETRTTNLKENLAAIQFIGQSGWAVGYDGVIIHSADGGKTWSPQQTGTKESLEGLFFLDAAHGWVVGWAGTILRTTDGGKTWLTVKSDAAQWSLSSVYFRDAQNGWIVGFAGTILRSRDGGATWTAQTSPVRNWLSAVLFDSSNRGWITADDSILVSEDGGENWKAINAEGLLFLSQLVPVDKSLWAIGQLGVLRHTEGLTWKRLENLVVDDPSKDTGAPAAATVSKLD